MKGGCTHLKLPLALIGAAALWALGLAVGGLGQQHALLDDGRRWFADYGYPRECAAAETTYRPATFEFKEACYPPLGYALVAKLPRKVQTGGLLFSGLCGLAFLVALVVFLARACDGRRTDMALWCAAVGLSAPMILALCAANQVLLSAAGVLVFLSWYDSPSRLLRTVAILALALASALKLTPAVFSLLLLKRREWKLFVICGVIGVLLVLVPFAWFGGMDGLLQFVENLKAHAAFYSPRTTWGFVALDRSLRIALQGNFEEIGVSFPYTRAASVVLGAFCLVRFFRAHARDRELLFLVAALSLLPGPSMPYTALYLVPAMVVGTEAGSRRSEQALWFLVFCSLQLPFGPGSLNHTLAAAAGLALIGLPKHEIA